MQGQELKLQRLELELTRTELQGQMEALQEQNEQARRTAEAAIMSQLMMEYDGMRNDIRIVQRFYEDSGNPEQALEAFRRGRTALDQNNPVAITLDQSRFEISRFFVRVGKLSTRGYLSRRIIWRVLGRQAIEDVFLNLVDPLDQVVNQIAGNPRSMADHDFFRQLLADRATLER